MDLIDLYTVGITGKNPFAERSDQGHGFVVDPFGVDVVKVEGLKGLF